MAQDDYRVPLAEGVRDGMSRAPVIVIFILGTLAILWLGSGILQERARERAELQERIDDLTGQLTRCYELRAERRATDMSAQNNSKP